MPYDVEKDNKDLEAIISKELGLNVEIQDIPDNSIDIESLEVWLREKN
jgi:hypothetical protein